MFTIRTGTATARATKAAPRVIFRAAKPKAGERPKDPTHAAAFCWKFAEICAARKLPCDCAETGDAFAALVTALKQ